MLADADVGAVTFLDRARSAAPIGGTGLPRMVHAYFPAPDPVSGTVFRLLAIATAARAPGFAIDDCAGWAAAIERLGGDAAFDAVLVDGDAAPASPAEIAAVAERAALVVVVVEPDAEHASGWLRSGADDVIGRDELAGAGGLAPDPLRRRAPAPARAAPARLFDRSRHRPAASPAARRAPQPAARPARARAGADGRAGAFASRACRPRGERRREHRLRDAAPQDRGAAARRRARQRRRRRGRRRHVRRPARLDPDRRRRRSRRRQARSPRWSRRSRSAAVDRSRRRSPSASPTIRTTVARPSGCCAGRWRSPRPRRRRRRRARRRFAAATAASAPPPTTSARRGRSAPTGRRARPAGAAPAMPDNRRPMPISLRLLAGSRRAILPPPKAPL